MDSRERGLLADVIANPGDDFPRLVYADWCEDNGREARAEFIRVQCEVAGIRPGEWCVNGPRDDGEPTSGCDCRRCTRLRRERELLVARENEWTPDPFSRLGVTIDRWGWRRGFIGDVRLPCHAWMSHGRALADAAPLELVQLSDRGPLEMRNAETLVVDWSWVSEDATGRYPQAVLPPALYRLLPRPSYPTEGEAMIGLSVACLAWACRPLRRKGTPRG
jgi:uncharacterized protein (TIGR02996 family)